MAEAPVVSVQNLKKIVAGRVLFNDLNFGVFAGEKMGMIGPNGAGKTTLLRIMAGLEEADHGGRAVQKNAVLSFVEQNPDFADAVTAEEYIRTALANSKVDEEAKPQMAAKTLSQIGLAGDAAITTLSGGWRKRLAIAAELARQPDLIFLDEPTNHLDFEGIRWLEKTLKSFTGAFLLISHDRSFLENVCNRVVEINPRYGEGYFSCEGNYSFFLQKRAEHFMALQQYEEVLHNKVRREVEWLRQGVKARTTKSKARARAAYLLQDQLTEVQNRNQQKTTAIEFVSTGKAQKSLLEVGDLSLSFSGSTVFSDLELKLKSGDRLALAGDNGAGKSCLLKILAGEFKADQGKVLWAEGAKVVYFDQNRDLLNPEQSVRDFLSEEGDTVYYLGRPLYVASYGRRFLFESEQLNLPIRQLSGGEKARLMIAKLMLNEADALLLDEPTNDLDIETMDAFAESLMEFPGAIILVSHDRYFVDQICDRVLVMKKGEKAETFADLAQWEASEAQKTAAPTGKKISKQSRLKPKKKLSYNEKREWEQMEEKILVAEEALERWKSEVENPHIAVSPDKLKEAFESMSEAQKLVDELYERWVELESKQSE